MDTSFSDSYNSCWYEPYLLYDLRSNDTNDGNYVFGMFFPNFEVNLMEEAPVVCVLGDALFIKETILMHGFSGNLKRSVVKIKIQT